ncbi:hypothetical protein MSj_03796 [Microcystis aeruginosa Sj]|uniref:Uncharacterized protein n=1 Tax=Microcystis aeruginosa Sj TaxID=1979544 RepID=A0A2Z6UXB6_MICAE|nr:hypothetical protein MSj_03796 [Microcystis aeruginosa Sj]
MYFKCFTILFGSEYSDSAGIRDLRFDNVPFGRTQFAPTLWTKSVTVGAQCLRPPIDWDIIPTQVPNPGRFFGATQKKTILGKMVKHNEYKPTNLTSDRFFWPSSDGQICGTVLCPRTLVNSHLGITEQMFEDDIL